MHSVFRFLVPCLFLNFTTHTFASWEYAGFSGANNEIKIHGSQNISSTPYPDSWDGLGEKNQTTCLCDKKTEGELRTAIKNAFGGKSTTRSKVSSGAKFVIFSSKDAAKPMVEVYGLFLRDSKSVDTAYSEMKENLPGDAYAFIKTQKGVFFAKKATEVPPRAFLHFVRGYDDTANECQANTDF